MKNISRFESMTHKDITQCSIVARTPALSPSTTVVKRRKDSLGVTYFNGLDTVTFSKHKRAVAKQLQQKPRRLFWSLHLNAKKCIRDIYCVLRWAHWRCFKFVYASFKSHGRKFVACQAASNYNLSVTVSTTRFEKNNLVFHAWKYYHVYDRIKNYWCLVSARKYVFLYITRYHLMDHIFHSAASASYSSFFLRDNFL